jgi:DNA-binding XRE family transcriptional regulator
VPGLRRAALGQDLMTTENLPPCKELYGPKPKPGVSGRVQEPNTLLGLRLRELRKAAGWTTYDMAARLGYSGNSRISNYELGKYLPTVMILRRYAEAFGITVSALLDGVM